MPDDPETVYTQASVIDGKFTYTSSARKTRYTAALVTWNDPRNFYRPKVEYVEYRKGMDRYGLNQAEATAFGCTSQGQAQRFGKWLCMTSCELTDTVTFRVGLEGLKSAPGQIVRIADPARAGKRQGGRIRSATKTEITVDKAPTADSGDTITVNMPDGTLEERTVSSVSGNVITVGSSFSVAPQAESSWMVETEDLAAQLFRVVSVTEDFSEDEISFTVTALQHNPSIFDAVDNGTILQVPPISVLTPKAIAPPTNVTIDHHQVVHQGTSQTAVTIAWDASDDAHGYDVEWKRGDGTWNRQASDISSLSVDIINAYAGAYNARVRSVNAGGDTSVWAYAADESAGESVTVDGKTVAPPPPTLYAESAGPLAIALRWDFPADVNVSDTKCTEVYVSETNDREAGQKLGEFAYPANTATINGLLPNYQRWAWARLIDKSDNVGAWSVAAHAITDSADALFDPIQDQLDQLD